MDTEEGVEVVWNEVLFSERKISEIQHVRENDENLDGAKQNLLSLSIRVEQSE